MAHPLIYPALAVTAVLGSSLGVYLGRSAIAEINPIYYSERQTRFHADLVPYRSFEAAPQVLTAKETEVALGSGCIGCRADTAAAYPIYEASAGKYQSGYASSSEPVEVAAYDAEPSADLQQRQAELSRIERYASYPVSHEEAASAPIEDQREAAPAVD